MRYSLGGEIARLEQRLARLGVRLGAAEHGALRVAASEGEPLRAELARIDEELWRIDLRLTSRGSDESLLALEMDEAEAALVQVERQLSKLHHPAYGARAPAVSRPGGEAEPEPSLAGAGRTLEAA